MRTMSWDEIKKDWAGLQKRHRMELAQAITRYCVGHTMAEVAKELGFTQPWVAQQLDFAGIAASIGGDQTRVGSWEAECSEEVGSHNKLRPAVNKVISEFAPSVDVKFKGRDKSEIAAIEGDDAEDFRTFLDHYLNEGHEPAAAVRLAKAEWAGEAAVEAGRIKESVNKKNERVNKILFPDKEKTDLELQLQTHMANVERAARFLDDAKLTFIKKRSTASRVLAANAKWSDQVDRIRGLHPSLVQES